MTQIERKKLEEEKQKLEDLADELEALARNLHNIVLRNQMFDVAWEMKQEAREGDFFFGG